MKKIMLLCAAVLLGVSCSSDANQSLLSGNIRGIKKGTLYLQQIVDTTVVVLDSVVFAGDGQFEFNPEVTEPSLYYLYLDRKDENPYNDRLPIFLEDSKIQVDAAWDTFAVTAKVSGSKTHDQYTEFQQMMSKFNQQNLALMQQAMAMDPKTQQKTMDSLLDKNNKNELRRYLFAINYALNNRNSVIAPYVAVVEIPEASPVFLDSIYRSLPTEVAQTSYGRALEALLQNSTK